MPTLDHESLLLLFRERPALAAELLRARGADVPDGRAVLCDGAWSEVDRVERRADLVIVIEGAAPMGIVVEVQLRRDEAKRYRWPLYVAALEDRLRHPVVLLVMAPNPSVARWARKPRAFGGRCGVFAPEVISREDVPRVRTSDAARASPELAVASILAHGHEPGAAQDALAIFEGLRHLDRDRARVYHDLVWFGLGAAARLIVGELMNLQNYVYKSDFAKALLAEGEAHGRAEGEAHGRAEGEAHGRAEAVLILLEARGFEVTPALRARTHACGEPAVLEQWLRRAATATRVDEVFDD